MLFLYAATCWAMSSADRFAAAACCSRSPPLLDVPAEIDPVWEVNEFCPDPPGFTVTFFGLAGCVPLAVHAPEYWSQRASSSAWAGRPRAVVAVIPKLPSHSLGPK